jgi:hypothetical protein
LNGCRRDRGSGRRRRNGSRGRQRKRKAAGARSASGRDGQSLAAVDAIALFAGEVIWHEQRLLAAGAFKLNRHEFTSSRGQNPVDEFGARNGPLVANAARMKYGPRFDAHLARSLVYTPAEVCNTGVYISDLFHVGFTEPSIASVVKSERRPRQPGYVRVTGHCVIMQDKGK